MSNQYSRFSDMFRNPTTKELAQRELEEAQLQVLQSLSQVEHSTAMVEYNNKRITRLNTYLNK